MASTPYEHRGVRRPPRNYAQLDLFRRMTADSTKTAAPETAAPETEATDERENRSEQMILKHWQTHHPQMVAELPSDHQLEQTLHEAQERTGDLLYELTCVQKMDYQAAWETAMRGMGIPSERGPPATIIRGFEPEQEKPTARDFRITASHHIGEGSLREKALANIEAIRTLKQIEAENRDATDAEKSILARYAGWGAMANAFRPSPPQDWQPVANQLRELLTKEEYEAARASTPNAHFTSPLVIEAMWQAMQRFGLDRRRADPRAVDGRRPFPRTHAGRASAGRPAGPASNSTASPPASRSAFIPTRPSSPKGSRTRRCPTITSTP